MPKRVDHEERRGVIADAVRRIAADRGLEAVSVSEVAGEAGISKGLVQHYFPSKDAMLRHATTTLRPQVEDRVAGRNLRDTVVALLPLDVEGRMAALVANAFLVRALKDEVIAERFRAGHALLRASIAAKIADEHPDNDDPAGEAELLLALVGGLGDAVLLGHRTGADAVVLLDRHLSRL